MFDDVTAQRFWSKVDKSAGPDACWPWIGATRGGYGVFCFRGKDARAHRVSLLEATGREDLFAINKIVYETPNLARHMCHNKRCVNPAHLKWGTPSQNTRDRPAECVAQAVAKANAKKAITGNWGGPPRQALGDAA